MHHLYVRQLWKMAEVIKKRHESVFGVYLYVKNLDDFIDDDPLHQEF